MSFLDDAKKKAEELADQHPDQVEKLSDTGLEKGGSLLDGATGGKFTDKIEQGEKQADERIGER